MSATNRGAVRNKNDFYETPQSCIMNFLNHHWFYVLPTDVFFDPGYGSGAFPRALRKAGYTNQIDAIDIDSMINDVAEVNNKYIGDFLTFVPEREYNIVIGNPPYSLAEQFIRKAFEIVDKDRFEIIMLLRLNFLESKKRHSFWQQHPVNDLYVLSERPSFTKGGTDATGYGFFVWNNSGEQHIYVI